MTRSPISTTCNSHAQQPARVKYFKDVECFCISGNFPLLPIRPLIWFPLLSNCTSTYLLMQAPESSFCRKTSALTCKPKPLKTTDLCSGRTQTWMESHAHPKNCSTGWRESKWIVQKTVILNCDKQFNSSAVHMEDSQWDFIWYLKIDFPFWAAVWHIYLKICAHTHTYMCVYIYIYVFFKVINPWKFSVLQKMKKVNLVKVCWNRQLRIKNK